MHVGTILALIIFDASWCNAVSRHLDQNPFSKPNFVTTAHRISHRDILTFNAWIFNVRTLIAQVQLLDRRVDDLLVCQEPVDLRAISFV